MQENNPVPTPEIPNPVAVEQPKQSNLLVILLTILLLISVAISGFFAYQTQELVKELNKLKTIEKTVAEDMSEPVATKSSEVDPTAGWKTYTNEKYGFSFKYPKEWKSVESPIMPNAQYISLTTFDIVSSSESKLSIVLFPNLTNINDWVDKIKESGLVYAKVSETKTIGKNVFYDVYGLGNNLDSKDYFVKADINGYIKLTIEPYSENEQKEIFGQILSTFKFLE